MADEIADIMMRDVIGDLASLKESLAGVEGKVIMSRRDVQIQKEADAGLISALLEACKFTDKWLQNNVIATDRPAILDKKLHDAIDAADLG